jgi:hypothetical protein
MGEEVAELHLYIARALQRLATVPQQQQKKAVAAAAVVDESKERKRRRGEEGGGKAKEAFGDDLEYEEEASEDEDEVTTKDKDDDEEEAADGKLIFEALDRFEEEWRREATRFERRLCELRASCLRWKVQQEITVQKMRLQLRREADHGEDDQRRRPTTGGSVVDRLVEALIELQAEGRHASHHHKRMTREKTQARSTPKDAENVDSECHTSELGSSASSPFSRSLDRDQHRGPEMNRPETAAVSNKTPPTTPPPERKSVSFTSASPNSSHAEGHQAAKEDDDEEEQASKQHRRGMSVDGLPSHKRDRKKKKKGTCARVRVRAI